MKFRPLHDRVVLRRLDGEEKTKAAILTFGHSERSIGDVKRFIDVYDPVKREVTVQLQPSVE